VNDAESAQNVIPHRSTRLNDRRLAPEADALPPSTAQLTRRGTRRRVESLAARGRLVPAIVREGTSTRPTVASRKLCATRRARFAAAADRRRQRPVIVRAVRQRHALDSRILRPARPTCAAALRRRRHALGRPRLLLMAGERPLHGPPNLLPLSHAAATAARPAPAVEEPVAA
jgi:hypothetical protein